jgi:hypothetical protein
MGVEAPPDACGASNSWSAWPAGTKWWGEVVREARQALPRPAAIRYERASVATVGGEAAFTTELIIMA